MNKPAADKIEMLESKIAFLEQELHDMRESVDAHQRQILDLEKTCELLTSRLRNVLDTIGDGEGAETSTGFEVPPHY
ncbi:MAG: SlyX family protein [Woeseiaceae bacterium]